MKKEEIISISAGDVKKFYSCVLLATEKYENGKFSIKGKIPDGKVTEYYSSILCTKNYKNGKLDGDMQISDLQNGVLLLEEKYQEGVLISAPNADNIPEQKKRGNTFVRMPNERIFYVDGREVGRQILDARGEVLSEKGQMLSGEAKEFYPNGGLKRTAAFLNGMPHGDVKSYDTDGRLIAIEPFKDGLKEGTSTYLSLAKGVLTEEKAEFSKGRLNGKRQVFGVSGQIISTETYKDDKLEGMKETFHLNGILESRCLFKNNLREGSRIIFYDNGKTMYDEYFSEGKLNGNRTGFFPDGTIFLEEQYKNGVLNGRRAVFDQQGKLVSEEFYEDGKLKEK